MGPTNPDKSNGNERLLHIPRTLIVSEVLSLGKGAINVFYRPS